MPGPCAPGKFWSAVRLPMVVSYRLCKRCGMGAREVGSVSPEPLEDVAQVGRRRLTQQVAAGHAANGRFP